MSNNAMLQHIHNQQLNVLNAQRLEFQSMPGKLNRVITYYEFFKSSLTNRELLTGIQDQMDLHCITLSFVNSYHSNYLLEINHSIPMIGEVTQACHTLWEIITELEHLCRRDRINPKP